LKFRGIVFALVGTAAFVLGAPQAAADTVAASKFTTGTDGWKVVGDTSSGAELPTHVPTGGDPGGYVSVSDAATGGVMYWRAPTSFRRNAEDAFKGTIRYSLRQSENSNQFAADDVILEGGGLRLTFRGTPPALAPTWTDYSVGLSRTGWVDATGSPEPATARDMKTVLTDLESLFIRAEYQTGADVDDLDTVVLKTPPPPD
jgi:hypothetical protein